MLRLILTFLVIAVVAALFGYSGLASGFATLAKVLFYIFLTLFTLSLIAGLVRGFK